MCAQLCAYKCSLGTSDSPTPSTFSAANVFTTQLGHFQWLHSNAHAFLTIKMLRFPFKQQKLNNSVNSGDKKIQNCFFFPSVLPNMARNGLLSVLRVSDFGLSPKTKLGHSKENKRCI